MKIVLIEDEFALNEIITEFLENEGYIVKSFFDGKEAYEYLSKNSYDIVILDIHLPNIDGFSILETLQNKKIFPPVIFISAMNSIEHITKAYKLGCFDYIKKPFYLEELLFKIEKLSNFINNKDKKFIKITKNYKFSVEDNELIFKDETIPLTQIHRNIIKLLAINKNKTVTFDLLREEIWNGKVDNSIIRAEISRLKKLLKEDFIQNIRGVGYIIK
ncbi:response regulator transcription factor [Caminibacter mediatlanticus TB-2]|uniref:Response regulator transcription factor n=1 Tax=Caminibacter mediatlanticus TB-2 TaxID=391592 RepID=A0AAI9AHT7_9BACT|nr:response regulator transcription factor [Caminibacter mediatlanticus]EDM23775.1 two component transcriptional regulator, winged helix family protein [Caminibacter mediatlanticus TB-2]QCT94669.1 response regulator transcription factor [Caminibacter mediatlanticus TB-2]